MLDACRRWRCSPSAGAPSPLAASIPGASGRWRRSRCRGRDRLSHCRPSARLVSAGCCSPRSRSWRGHRPAAGAGAVAWCERSAPTRCDARADGLRSGAGLTRFHSLSVAPRLDRSFHWSCSPRSRCSSSARAAHGRAASAAPGRSADRDRGVFALMASCRSRCIPARCYGFWTPRRHRRRSDRSSTRTISPAGC